MLPFIMMNEQTGNKQKLQKRQQVFKVAGSKQELVREARNANDRTMSSVDGHVAYATKPRKQRRVRTGTGSQRLGVDAAVAASIARSIADPEHAIEVRWPDNSSSKTATGTPWAEVPCVFGGTNTSSPYLPPTDSVAFIFRCAERAMIYHDPNLAASQAIYTYMGTNLTNGGSTDVTSSSYTVQATPGVSFSLPFSSAIAASTYAPHGSCLFAGADESGRRYLYHEAGANIVLNFTTSTESVNVGANLDCILYKLVDGKALEVTTKRLTINSTYNAAWNTSIPSISGGYYSIDVCLSNCAPTATLSTTGSFRWNTPTMCHLAMPGYYENMAACDAMRIHGASLLLTNQAAVLSRQGKIIGWQSPTGKNWFDYLSNSTNNYKALTNLNGSVTMTSVDGAYRWMQMTGTDDNAWQSYSEIYRGTVIDSKYPLTRNNSFVMLYANVTNTAGMDFYWTCRFLIEYETVDVWRDTACSDLTDRQVQTSLELLRQTPSMTENPLHIGDIWNAVKSGAKTLIKGVIDYGPTIMRIARLLA